MLKTIAELAAELGAGRTSSRALVEAALARIADPAGEGARVFLKVDADAALEAADASDRLRRRGVVPSPLAGLPVSVKDLFDIAGQPTAAGSVVLRDAAPAVRDAPAVARLRAAGAILIGRSNMAEFAYSGLGLNAHFGTPGNPHDRERVPGGSSSGAGVSVADAMSAAALGSDTGGSVRIPAALCGISGFKPTQARVPLEGALPLSSTLDSVGPLAPTIECCAVVDAVLAGEAALPLPEMPLSGLRLAVPRSVVMEGLDDAVAAAFQRALSRFSAGGAQVVEQPCRELDEILRISRQGGITAAEAFAWHRELLHAQGERYDPRIRRRIETGGAFSAADYIDLLRARRRLRQSFEAANRRFDAVLWPTVATVAPRFDEVDLDDDYLRRNALVLRNCLVVNYLDRCAATLPCQAPGELPVGLMAVGEPGGDRRLLAVAAALQRALAD